MAIGGEAVTEAINTFVMNCLDVIFCTFIVCTIINAVLGIDILAGIRKLWEKITRCSSREK